MSEAFQLTPSRRATTLITIGILFMAISTHALTEGDASASLMMTYGRFQLTPSRRATDQVICTRIFLSHFNSRPHGGRPLAMQEFLKRWISTHALTEGDYARAAAKVFEGISTHALTEGDPYREPLL